MLNRFTKKNTLELVCSVFVQDPNLENNKYFSLSLAYTSSFHCLKGFCCLTCPATPSPHPIHPPAPSPPTPTNERTHARTLANRLEKEVTRILRSSLHAVAKHGLLSPLSRSPRVCQSRIWTTVVSSMHSLRRMTQTEPH